MKIKLTVLFIILAMLTAMTLACGEEPAAGSGDSGAGAAAGDGGEPAGEEPTPAPTPAPTDPPPPTEPPPTEPPTEPFEVDASLPYWDQIYSELEWYGLSGGVMAFNAANVDNDNQPDERGLMRRFGTNNTRREEIDVSGDGVPFSAAYKVHTSRDMENFWDASYNASFARDLETNEDDIVAGVIWIKGRRLEESDEFMEDDPADFYMAIKSPTDNWASEGQMEPFGRMSAEDEWERILWTGRVVNEEPQSSQMGFNIYMGYGIQEFEIGGIVAWIFPSTTDNERAAMKIHF